MKHIPSSWYLYAAAGLAVIALFVAIAVNGVKSRGPSVYDGFAQCLSDKGAKMYGTWWCTHCKNQKSLFGTAFQYVPYVECSPNGTKVESQECKDAGIEGFPTWTFADKTMSSGELSLQALSDKTSCPLPVTDASTNE
jgi:hypothetical protein